MSRGLLHVPCAVSPHALAGHGSGAVHFARDTCVQASWYIPPALRAAPEGKPYLPAHTPAGCLPLAGWHALYCEAAAFVASKQPGLYGAYREGIVLIGWVHQVRQVAVSVGSWQECTARGWMVLACAAAHAA